MATLSGYDDWSNLNLRGGAIGSEGAVVLPDQSDMNELTPEMAKLFLPLDTVAPVTAATASPAPNTAGWYKGDVTVTLAASDDVSGVARTEYNIDGAGWTQYTGAVVVGSEGMHTVQYRSIDRSQNQEPAKTLSFKIDKTPPVVALTAAGATGTNGWYVSLPGAITVNASDPLSGVAGIDCQDDVPGLVVSGSGTSRTLTLQGEAVHHLSCTSADVADNRSAPSTLTIKIDMMPPTISCAVNPTLLSPIDNTMRTIQVTLGQTDAGSGPNGFALTRVYSADGPPAADISGFVAGTSYGVGTTSVSGQLRAAVTRGNHGRSYQLTFVSYDAAGNQASCTLAVEVRLR